MKARATRLTRVEAVIGILPPSPRAVKEALEEFRSSGELPEDVALGRAVVQRARDGFEMKYDANGRVDWPGSIAAVGAARPTKPDRILRALYDEAIHGPGLIQAAARHVLRTIAQCGRDVTTAIFDEAEFSLPEFGGVGLKMLGFPERLIEPPHEDQARRLLERVDELRRRLPARDPRWCEEFRDAFEMFVVYGDIPDDPLIREAVLAEGETQALLFAYRGDDVDDLLAAYDRASRDQPDNEALEALGRLHAATGR